MIRAQAIVFDVGNVLFHWDLRALFSQLIADEAQLDHFMNHVLTLAFHERHDQGEALDQLVAELTRRHPGHAKAIQAYAERFNETITGPVAGSHELVARLAERGVPLFGLTNFSEAFWAGFHPTAPVFGHFADIVVSGVEKCAKPDPAIYAIAEARFGHSPEALFFTDDNHANIEAAAARGWQTHLFEGAAELEAALVAHGLLD